MVRTLLSCPFLYGIQVLTTIGGQATKVLLVDDEPDFLEQARLFLEKEDDRLDIETTTSAEEALKMLEEGCYDAVVSDYQMPGMNGLEFLEMVRKDGNDIPFIVFTGKGREEVAVKALNLGANRYLQKGGDPRAQYGVLAQAIVQEVKHQRSKEEAMLEKERFEELFEGANEFVVITDPEGYVKKVNRRMLEASGYSEDEVVGANILEFAHPEDREKFIKGWKRVLEGKEDTRTVRAVSKEGDVHWLRAGGRPIIEDGEVVEIQYNIQDITELKEAEKEAEREKERYRNLLDSIPQKVFYKNKDSEYITANPSYARDFDLEPEELVGKTDYDLFPEELAEKYRSDDRRVMELEEKMEFDEEYTMGDEKRLVHTVKSPVYDAKGNVRGVLGIFWDITRRKEAEEEAEREKERFEELFEGANEMIITTDREGYVYRANKAVEEVSGYSEEELKGESILKVAHPEDRDKYIEFWKRVLNGEEPVYQLRGLSKNGKTVHLAAGGRPIMEDGEIIEIQYNAHDITELRKTQEREEFLHSLLRHDLKNKAQIARGYCELLKDTDLSEEQKQYLEKADVGIREGVELIDKVRMLREIEEEEVGEVRIDPIIEKVVSENESHASERGIEIEVGCNFEGKVRGGSLFKELFSNLVGNSIQHSDCDRIKISAQDQDGEYLVSVEDNGKGIPDEDKTKIFERGFKKGSSVGSGLGTFLAKEIAENYGGSIEVKDSELGGARFDVHLKKV